MSRNGQDIQMKEKLSVTDARKMSYPMPGLTSPEGPQLIVKGERSCQKKVR